MAISGSGIPPLVGGKLSVETGTITVTGSVSATCSGSVYSEDVNLRRLEEQLVLRAAQSSVIALQQMESSSAGHYGFELR